MTIPRPLLLAILGLGVVTAPLGAQVTYVRELSFSSVDTGSVLPLTKAPVDTSDPLYDPDLPDTQWPSSSKFFWTFDPTTGISSGPQSFPAQVKVLPSSFTTLIGVGTSEPILAIRGFARALYLFNLGTGAVSTSGTVPLAAIQSLAAANRNTLSAIGDGGFYTIDPATAATTQIFSFTGGTQPGEFSLDTFYHSYGPNGLLYMLDYGNGRMQMLNPADAFAPVGQFSFQSGATTANQQFAIGPTGNIYLGDGLGGGSSYAADGTFLETFLLPGSVTGDPFTGVPYLSTDATNGVFVFDTTGFHQYADPSVVPEPATVTLLLLGLTVAIAFRGRQRNDRGIEAI